MILAALDRPDDPAALAGWLEGHLAGTTLHDLAAELAAVLGSPPSDGMTLDRWLGNSRDAVLQRGLSALSTDQLNDLLHRPALLLQLQEEILIHGDSHWQKLIERRSEFDRPVERGLQQLRAATAPATRSPERPKRREWYSAFITAAVLLVAAWGLGQFLTPQEDNWGWNRAGAMAQAGSPKEYLNRLADEADDWFKKSPENASQLARRINEMRQGCTKLIMADHTTLAAADRDWLKDRCRAWAGKFDQQLAALEKGDDPANVKKEMDDIVHKLQKAMRERAISL